MFPTYNLITTTERSIYMIKKWWEENKHWLYELLILGAIIAVIFEIILD